MTVKDLEDFRLKRQLQSWRDTSTPNAHGSDDARLSDGQQQAPDSFHIPSSLGRKDTLRELSEAMWSRFAFCEIPN